ncbi:MAG: phosphate signaling complex protein PhoU [Methanotrichaceae archaeon]|nr:phosphate signaling complex protein PhoU [Methanotrichaceae archaeon]
MRYRERYRNELNDINSLTKKLADQVSIAIDQSVKALKESNADLGKEVIQGDQNVDDLSQEIENMCMELLALQQPMAKDLRQIIGILKISIDLERIGDLAVDIARVSVQSKQGAYPTKLEVIPLMAEIARKMLSQTMEALTKHDADEARQATRWDYEIDRLYVKARDRLFKLIIERPEIINDVISLLMVNRHLERIGDHICNICESIVYMVEAKREHLN